MTLRERALAARDEEEREQEARAAAYRFERNQRLCETLAARFGINAQPTPEPVTVDGISFRAGDFDTIEACLPCPECGALSWYHMASLGHLGQLLSEGASCSSCLWGKVQPDSEERIALALERIVEHFEAVRAQTRAGLIAAHQRLRQRSERANRMFDLSDHRVASNSPHCPADILTERDRAEAEMIAAADDLEAFEAAHPDIREGSAS